MKQAFAVGSISILALGFAAGCGAADAGEEGEEIGAAKLAQVDGGCINWQEYTARYSDTEVFARVVVIGDEDVGGYSANTEYWYIDKGLTSDLGSRSLTISAGSCSSSAPPSYGGSSIQAFSLPALATWQSFTSDPVSGGSLYDNGNLHLRIARSGELVSGVTWYQTIPSSNTPANVTPSGTFTTGSGSVSIPSGQAGYFVDQTP